MVFDDIKEHPSYVCNQLALKLGALGACLTSVANLFYQPPNNILLAIGTFGLGLLLLAVRQLLLPRAQNCRQLDFVVFIYIVPIILLQWFALACFPESEVSTATGCMLVMTGLLFTSIAWVIPIGLLTAGGWLFWKSYLGGQPNSHEIVQLLIIVPVMAAVARLATARSIIWLQLAKQREQETVAELRGALGKLKEETERRKSSEAQLLQAQKNESLGLMAAGVAHDFNNMLSAIHSYADIIQLGTQDAEIQGFAQDITRAVNQAAAICRQMLIYAGKSTSQKTDVDLVTIATDMQALLQASFTRRVKIEFSSSITSAPVEGNATQLQQLLLNLVTNGAEAIEGKGCIDISISREIIDEGTVLASDIAVGQPATAGEYYAISVTDSGKGIDAETMLQMFDPYFTTKGSGHGFGLSTVLGIAKHHNAAITVKSRLGQGTKITLWFPLARVGGADQPFPESPVNHADAPSQPTVLLVEDDELVRNSVAQMLTAQGWVVVRAESGEAAMRFIQQSNTFSVLIIDFNMPSMNGPETLLQLRQMGCQSPAILFSGTICPVKEEIADFAAFLPKPLRWNELDTVLKGLMRPA